MKHTRKQLSDSKIELAITLDATDLNSVRPLTITKLSQNLKVPGFRQGKVPVKVAEKNLSREAIESQLMEDAVNKYVVEVLINENVQPLDRPHVEIQSVDPGEKLEFTATVDILPPTELGDYKKLKVTTQPIKVTEKDINEVIDRMRQGFAEKKEVNRAAKDGDEVVIDFEGKDKNGEPVAGATGKDYPLALGSKTFIPGFEEGLLGKKRGDKFDLPLKFPKDYHHEPLKGAEVNFAVTVKKVSEVNLPKVDDEFAKKCGPFKDIAELKSDIRREVESQKQRTADDQVKDALVEQLVKVSKVPAPDVLVKDQMDSIERDTIQNLMYRGMTIEQYLTEQGLTHDEWREKELKESAIRRVQVGLALAELSKAEKIDVSKEELDARHGEFLSQYNDPKIRSQLDTPEARRDMANRVITEKTVDRLVELNK